MKLNKRITNKEYDRAWVESAHKWCNRFHMAYNGLTYDDPLAGPDGVSLALIVPEGTSDEEIEKAIEVAYQTSDIVSHYSIIVPKEWLQ